MKLIRLFLFFFVLLSGNVSLFSQSYDSKFRNFTLAHGLSTNFITSIGQDSKGFIWVGTNDGLNKYDGYKFTVYRKNEKLPGSINGNHINAIFTDSRGDLYIGTGDGGLNRYDAQKDQFISYQHDPKDESSILANSVSAIYEDDQGELWIGSDWGLSRLDRKTQKFTRFVHDPANPNSLTSNFIRSICSDKNGNLWVGTETGISVLDKTRKNYTHYQHKEGDPQSLSSNPIRKIFSDSKGRLWIATVAGFNLFNEQTNTFTNYFQGIGPTNIVGNYVPGICEAKDGSIWVATNIGISVLKNGEPPFINFQNDPFNPNSLVDNGLNTIFCDQAGNIWVGSIAGISMKDVIPTNFPHYRHTPGNNLNLGGKEVYCFYEDSQSNIWLGLRGGFDLFDRKTNTFVHHQTTQDGLGLGTITSFYEDTDKNFWIGSFNAGIFRYNRNSNTYEVFSHGFDPVTKEIIPFFEILYFQQDARGDLYAVSFAGGIFKYNKQDNKFYRYTWENKIPIAGIRGFYIDKEQNLWIGTTAEGLIKINQEKNIHEVYKHDPSDPQSISDNLVLSIFEDQKGNFWVGTSVGLNRMDRVTGTFESFNGSDGLPGMIIQGIQEDNLGNLWIGTNKGLSRFDPTGKIFKNFTVDDGLQYNEFGHRSAYKLRSGELLFGGINGFNIFNPATIVENKAIPEVYIVDFQIFNDPVPVGVDGSPLQDHITATKEVTLSYKQSVFSFEFAGLNFISSKNNQYAYKLEGFDKNWNYVGNRRTATYTNLDPGTYNFKVKASNNNGVWNEKGTALKLIITPPFWQTWWFRVLVATALAGSAITFYLVRMNAIKAQKEELEKQVTERTAEVVEQKEELLQQREEIEVQRDNLQKVNEHVMSSIQYANTIQKAILPHAQKMKAVLNDFFIIYRPKDVVSGDFYWFAHLTKEETGIGTDLTFIAAVDCTGHGVPGAFMSIIGNTLLNEIVNQKRIYDPARILDELNIGVKAAVGEAEGVNTAGMDVCLCRIEKGEGNQLRILYCGAKRPLYYIKTKVGAVEQLDGDRKSIGSESRADVNFTTQELVVEEGTMLYLTSDGYADQNNMDREKLGSHKFREAVATVFSHPLHEQKLTFENLLDNHMEEAEQRDDITIIGVKL